VFGPFAWLMFSASSQRSFQFQFSWVGLSSVEFSWVELSSVQLGLVKFCSVAYCFSRGRRACHFLLINPPIKPNYWCTYLAVLGWGVSRLKFPLKYVKRRWHKYGMDLWCWKWDWIVVNGMGLIHELCNNGLSRVKPV